jgi:RNA polymerase sigma factor (sigma-70 family)
MVRGYPGARNLVETDDVLQGALLRLARALGEVHPSSTAEFFTLAAALIRRELLDLARLHRQRLLDAAGVKLNPPDPNAADRADLDRFDRWHALHEAVERLPPNLRNVFDLAYYLDWTQPEIAKLLAVSDRQVRRLWSMTRLRLNEMLASDLERWQRNEPI